MSRAKLSLHVGGNSGQRLVKRVFVAGHTALGNIWQLGFKVVLSEGQIGHQQVMLRTAVQKFATEVAG